MASASRGPGTSTAGAAPTAPAVDVRSGDCLWDLAAAGLSPDASAAEINERWQAIWQANRDLVGANPNLIQPGQHLAMPEAGR